MKKFIFIIVLLTSFFPSLLLFAQENSEKSTKSDPNVPIFEIKNDAGQTVFAVYPGGVSIFIDNTLKSTGGGFKVGSLGTGKATSNDYFTVQPGTVQVNIANGTQKSTGGGFKVGSLGTGKASGNPVNFMSVTSDSTRIYTNESSNKGFAVGKSGAINGTQNFLNL